MRKIFKIAALVAVGVVAYKKIKESDFITKKSDDMAKATTEVIKEKIDSVMHDDDVVRMIKRKAQRVVDDIFEEKSLDRFAESMKDDIIRETRRRVKSKIVDYLFE